MKLHSCQNCWFNGLQYGAVGLSFGYCARHRKVLNLPDETTCGQHIRKDLSSKRAEEVAVYHSKAYADDKIVRLTTGLEVASDASAAARDVNIIRSDIVGESVVDYGYLDSKIESLAQLRGIRSARSDIALTSLGRAYVQNCARRGGRWTSGIHLFWWTKKRLAEVPQLRVEDIRYAGHIQLSRQTDLAAWSVMMFKLYLLDDIVSYAGIQNDVLGRESGIANSAAIAVPTFNVRKLSAWISRELLPALEARLDYERYSELSRELHQE
ncbi:hypothetical protein EV283_0010 [Sphingomonas sp. BK036]|uniref:hypothetical protein n=1 Tax=Sphingomonas sp. BK036 TaxID=2512122 RepID=UPI00102A85AE|nr:hypothetical protein [Sphingomonas sp. BK036]RZT58243.1 hypothetical protein EV283_0010 [Sphingomonas sp. BK036]